MTEIETVSARPFAHLILGVVLAFFLAAGYWASHAILDEVTRGEGRVIPSRQIQVVQNLEGGIVSEILVREGQTVARDALLLRLATAQVSTDLRKSRSEVAHLQARISRLQAEAEGQPLAQGSAGQRAELIRNERAEYESRKSELDTVLSMLQAKLEQQEQELAELKVGLKSHEQSRLLISREIEITKEAVAHEAMPEIKLVKLKREMQEIDGRIQTTRAAIPRLEAAIRESRLKVSGERKTFAAQAMRELNLARAELSGLMENMPAAQDRVSRTEVRSPMRGIVKKLHVNTVRGVVQPGMDLIEIVPLEDRLVVEARIRPSDIGFLYPDQSSVVKFTAYDSTIYGGLPARLEHISADTIIDEKGERYYVVRLHTESNYLGSEQKQLKIIPGMTVTVEILTGKKSVLDYLLKPILKVRQAAMRER